jgi:metal-responsive CopG/Arc/MetJ family transcriptional regulator
MVADATASTASGIAATVLPGHTSDVKTAISVPDPTFEAASRRARELGMSRSEFFSKAAAHYLAELDAASLTTRLNAALETVTDDEAEAAAVRAGRRTLLASEW